MNSTMVHGARLVGPALAGLLIHEVGEALCFLLDGLSYIGVIGARRTLPLAAAICLVAAFVFALRLPALRRIVRPIYVQKGVIREVAKGMEAAAEVQRID